MYSAGKCLTCRIRQSSLQVAIAASGCFHALVSDVTLTPKETLQAAQVCTELHTKPSHIYLGEIAWQVYIEYSVLHR